MVSIHFILIQLLSMCVLSIVATPSEACLCCLFLQLPASTDKVRFLAFKDVMDMGVANPVPFEKYTCVMFVWCCTCIFMLDKIHTWPAVPRGLSV